MHIENLEKNSKKKGFVPATGLEPVWVAPADFESTVSTNFTTPAKIAIMIADCRLNLQAQLNMNFVLIYCISMQKRIIALLLFLIVSASAIFAFDDSMAYSIFVSDIPVTYGDESFRNRILERTKGERDPIGLVLTGGSARAIAHLGVLQYLEENDIIPDFIISNSMGSIIGMLYAAGFSVDQIMDMLLSFDISSLFSATFPVQGGFLEPTGLETLLRTIVGDTRLEDLEIPVMVVCGDLVTKREIRICEGNFTDVLLASFALPVYFSPREYRGHLLIDGGIITLAPINAAYEYTDTVIISTTFYNIPTLNLRNLITILNSAFDIGKNQRVAADMHNHPDSIWIRCDVEQVSFMDFKRSVELAENGYNSAAAVKDELASLHHSGVSEEMKNKRLSYETAFKSAIKGLRYFNRMEAVSPSYTLGLCFESDQGTKYRRFLNDSVDLAIDFNYRYRGFESGLSVGFAFDFTTPETAGVYPMIEGFVAYYLLDNLRFTLEASFDFNHSPWYIPELYTREGLDWVIFASKNKKTAITFSEALEYRTDFQGDDAIVLSTYLDGRNNFEYLDTGISFGYLLLADDILFDNPRNFVDLSVDVRMMLLPQSSIYIDLGTFTRLSLGQGNIPLFLSDGYTSPMIGKNNGFVKDAADIHMTMLSVALGYDVPFSATFGEFLILEETEAGIYCDFLIRDNIFSVSTGVEFQTMLSLIGLVDLPFRMRLGYDSWSAGFASSFLIALKR